jgi:hypothetical protein
MATSDRPRTTALAPYSLPTLEEFKDSKAKMGSAAELWKFEPRSKPYRCRLVIPQRGRPSSEPASSHFCDFGNKKIVSANCPVEMKIPGHRCAVHEYLERLSKSKNPQDLLRVKEWKANGCMYVNLYVRDEMEKPMPWRGGWGFVGKLQSWLDEHKNNPQKNANPFDPSPAGFDFTVLNTKKNGKISYEFDRTRDCFDVPLHEDPAVVDQWIRGAVDLREYSKIKPFDSVQTEIENAERGGAPPPDDRGMRPGQPIDVDYTEEESRDGDPANYGDGQDP